MKISIITVVKNDRVNLLKSVHSILSQNQKNFEYIIYDGMSNDGTKNFIKKYLKKNIKYICRKDKNYYDGLNYAIKMAKGEYIGILNAGDIYFDSQVLKKIIKKIKSTKFDLLFGNLIYVDNKKNYLRIWNYTVKKLNPITALKIASSTLVVKKKILVKYPYNTFYSISSDVDFNINISKKYFKFIHMNEFMIFMKSGGMSTNPSYFFKKLKQDFLILKNHFGIFFLFIYFYKIFIKIYKFKIIKNKKI